MKSTAFPRTMVKGRFKGQHFATWREYNDALEANRNGKRPTRSPEEHRFDLTITHGSMRMALTGDPRSDSDVDRLLDLLVEYAKTWKGAP